jgi:hypothetical protein
MVSFLLETLSHAALHLARRRISETPIADPAGPGPVVVPSLRFLPAVAERRTSRPQKREQTTGKRTNPVRKGKKRPNKSGSARRRRNGQCESHPANVESYCIARGHHLDLPKTYSPTTALGLAGACDDCRVSPKSYSHFQAIPDEYAARLTHSAFPAQWISLARTLGECGALSRPVAIE